MTAHLVAAASAQIVSATCNRGRRRHNLDRDVGNLLRSSERPVSTTIQVFWNHDANLCILTASLVECAGLRFEKSLFPARRGGVFSGVAECLQFV
ncbi:MAG: hypothetical protein DME54_14480 [Verrucomicrobia bacterium]|nr:MAG: hypothetical protein DMF09_02645 [Verrucomicrobiota bacterium]PYJ47924.1 MAG: hypothetical protein DME85_02905 [Verrucomicrobiota bacterium]PYK32911.1 MAG: hypothetical protein DME54_14480 [Verrucomicrobiota bacterium]PYL20472.1 MAG: hypothetical protein DMF41_06080 [Verrucomicrobiota bacterium]PYL79980.1 MAG: hypothetical protein DMF21_10770 [Verrucomicrobiota bacterium]